MSSKVGRMLILLVVMAGSASGAFAEEQTEIPLGPIRKRIGVALFVNRTPFQDSRFVTLADKTITDFLRESCSDAVPVTDENPDFSEMRNKQPRRISGNIDNMTLAVQGRKSGLNAILTGEITGIKAVQEEHGYLWFKDMVFYIHVHMQISVYDTETGAKLLEEYLSGEEEIPENAYYKAESGDITPALSIIENMIVSLSRELADKACDSIEDEPFKTYVKSADGQRITLSAGRNAGIRKGSLFSIHDSGRIMPGKEGYKYMVPGLETGRLRVDTVHENSAEGSIAQGEIKGNDPCLKLLEE